MLSCSENELGLEKVTKYVIIMLESIRQEENNMEKLVTQVQGRRTGKTTDIIKEMERDPSALLIIHVNAAREYYPEELQRRIFSVRSFLNGRYEGRTFSRVLIDEAFIIDPVIMAKLYYHLGQYEIPTLAVGSRPRE